MTDLDLRALEEAAWNASQRGLIYAPDPAAILGLIERLRLVDSDITRNLYIDIGKSVAFARAAEIAASFAVSGDNQIAAAIRKEGEF